jgi:hypothetical protein
MRGVKLTAPPITLLGVEPTQQLLECRFSCFVSGHHGLKKDRGMLYRTRSTGAIYLPPPRVWRWRPVLYDDRVVSLIKTELMSRPVFSTLWKVCCNLF